MNEEHTQDPLAVLEQAEPEHKTVPPLAASAAFALYGIPLLVVGALIALDQLVKRWAVTVLEPVSEIPLIEGFIRFAYVENDGAAFGILGGGRWFFIPLTSVILIALLVYYARIPRVPAHWKMRVPLIFIVAGAAGNFIDRVRNGYVVDMFEFVFVTFPVFNIADACLVCGTLALAAVLLFFMKEEPAKADDDDV